MTTHTNPIDPRLNKKKCLYFELITCWELLRFDTLLSDILVKPFYSRIVSEKVQALPVRFPQELDPWCEDGSISSILKVFSTHSFQQQATIFFKIIHTYIFVSELLWWCKKKKEIHTLTLAKFKKISHIYCKNSINTIFTSIISTRLKVTF